MDHFENWMSTTPGFQMFPVFEYRYSDPHCTVTVGIQDTFKSQTLNCLD